MQNFDSDPKKSDKIFNKEKQKLREEIYITHLA